MNNGVTLHEAMARKPFQPVRLYLKDGRVLEVPARYYAVVGNEYVAVGKQAAGRAEGICSSITRVPVSEVTRVEVLAATFSDSTSNA